MPEIFGKYNLIQKIAQGGMAEIFLATREGELGGFEKQVAIKRIFRHLTGREETVNMFFDEARIAATLNHPNIVQVYDLGEVEGYFYIAMEFVHGTDLRRVCKRGLDNGNYLPIYLATHIVANTAAGLHYAHTRTDDDGNPRNIVHRDISPQNVLLSMDGHVKICDFGIAKAENRLARTRTGQFKGKLSYMSPEQFNGEFVDARSDVFNLGIVLYEITLARRLFNAKTDFERMRQIANAQVTPPSEIRPDFPPDLEAIIMKALASDPADRYQTAEQMQLELEEWVYERNKNVGAVQISNYMEQVFPELVGGIPEDMAQVEFPSGGRDAEPEQGSAPPPSVQEKPEELRDSTVTDEDETEQFRTDMVPDGGREAEEDDTRRMSRDDVPMGDESSGATGSSEATTDEGNVSGTYGSITIDPSKQRNRGERPTGNQPQAREEKEIPDDPEQLDENVDRTQPIVVDREKIEAAAAEEESDTTKPTPIREQEEDRGRARRDSAEMTGAESPDSQSFSVRPRHQSDQYADQSVRTDRPETTESVAGREAPTNPSGRAPQREQHPSGQMNRRDSRPSQPVNPSQPHSRSQSPGGPQSQQSRGVYGGGGGPGETGEMAGGSHEMQAQELEPKSKLRQTWEDSVDAVSDADMSLDDRKQKILALVGFGAALIGLGIFGYLVVAHKPAMEKDKKKKKIKAMAAEKSEEPAVELVDAHIVSKPKGANVVVNGLDTGKKTPATVSVVKGKQNEIYLFKKGHMPERLVVKGESDGSPPKTKLSELGEKAKKAVVTIEADPKGAVAYLDGRKVGTTPVDVEDVAAEGRHHLRLEADGYHPYFVLFDMRDKGKTIVSANLAKSRGGGDDDYCEVVYDIVPQGAMVQVNGKVQGTSNIAVRHTCGQHLAVSTWRSNYRDGKHFLHLGSTGKYLVQTRLEKIVRAKGTVSLEVPDKLRVYVGSNSYGKGSVEELELPGGEHTAVFETDDRDRFEETIKVRPGTMTKYRVRLQEGETVLERIED